MPAVDEILEGKGICICAGSGGVGKTTTSAAIATGMAARGLKVCVLTIDPAKRLADSLGLAELGNEARRVDPALLEAQGVEMEGELWAMMLDAKATFDELVARQAPDEESRDRVLENRIYQQISSALAGSQEYMAMEKLFELHTEGRFDLLVLDTPPTRNALDFLDAPKRLTQFIEGRSLRMFMKPTGLAARVAGRGATVALSVLKRIVGFDLLSDLAEFFNAFSGMVDGLPGTRQAGEHPARRSRHLLPGRLRPAGRACRRGRLLPPQAGGGGSCPSAASSSTRSTTRPSACSGERDEELGGRLDRAARGRPRPRPAGWSRTSPTTRRWPSAMRATSTGSRGSCGRAA